MQSEGSWNTDIAGGVAAPLPTHASVGTWRAATGRLLQLPDERRQIRLRAVRDGLLISGLLATAFVLGIVPAVGRSLGYDAFAYWSIDPATLYEKTISGQYALGGFRYGPPIGLLFATFHALPWWLFLWIWIAVMVAALVFLGGRWSLALLAVPPLGLELEHGNVHLLIAAAIVLGFRWPWTWSFVLLTKVTPGIGLLWFAARREWRNLAIALGFTAAVSAAAYLLAPALWSQWVHALLVNSGQTQDYSVPSPLVIRLPLAILLVLWGARTDRPWTVGVAAMLALPIIWVHGLVVAFAAVPFLRRQAAERRTTDPLEARSRFIALGQVLGRDPAGSAAGSRRFGPHLIGTAAVILGVAMLLVLIAGPLIHSTLNAASSSITLAAP